jgi:hypothetical protein
MPVRSGFIGVTCIAVLLLISSSGQGASANTSPPSPGALGLSSCGGESAPALSACQNVVVTLRTGDPALVAARHAALYRVSTRFVYRAALRGYAAAVPISAIPLLRDDSAVAKVDLDHRIKTYGQVIPSGISRVFALGNSKLAIDGRDSRVDADIAILDSGVDREHPDLNLVARTDCTAVVPGAVEETVNCLDDAGDDRAGHGTHVAGTAAAIDNGEGVVGVAAGARLWSVKVIGDSGFGSDSQLIAGIDWVTAHADRIEVANLSLGCAFCQSDAVDAAISNSVARGVVYVVAAGNEGMDTANISPANHPEVITVSALADFDGLPGGRAVATCGEDEDDTLAVFSNFGPSVELTGPGTCIRSTLPGGRYGESSGTSMGTPHVSGAAALLASASKPAGRAAVLAVRDELVAAGNADWTDDSGDGIQEPLLDLRREDLFAPRMSAGPFNALPLAAFTRSCDHRLRCSFDARASYDRDGRIRRFLWEISGGESRDGTPKFERATGATLSHKFRRSGTYTVRLIVTDDRGAVGRQAALVTVMKAKEQSLAKPSCGASGDEKCEQWVASYDNPNGYRAEGGLDVAEAVSASAEGSIFVTGSSEDNATASTDAATVAFSRNGRRRWVARHAGTGGRIDGGAAVAVSPDGRRVFVAATQDVDLWAERPLGDVATLAYDAATGRRLWLAHFGAPDLFETVAEISVSPDGRRLYIAGSRDVPGCQVELAPEFLWPCSAYLTVAYDAKSGRELWTQNFGVGEQPLANGWAMRTSPDGRRVYVTGTAFDSSTSQTVNATVAYDASSGRRLWEATEEGAGFTAILAVDPSGSKVYVTCGAEATTTTAYAAETGQRLWAAEETDIRSFSPQALIASAETVYLTGSAFAFGPTGFDVDAVTTAYAATSGAERWQARYEGLDSVDAPTTQSASAIQVAAGRVLVSGSEADAGDGGIAAFTVAYDGGARLWSARYNSSVDPAAPGGAAVTSSTLAPDAARLYVTGFFADPANSANLANYALLAYDLRRR